MKSYWQAVVSTLVIVGMISSFGCQQSSGPKKGELVIWHWMTDREDALADLAELYQKQTGLKVHLELYAPSDAYSSKVRASAQTNTLPDIFGVLG